MIILLLVVVTVYMEQDVVCEKQSKNQEIDTSGYILYCPCMGRFGNQADQFIGALSFAKGLGRTLVLPPWITYPSNRPYKSLQIPFEKWFKVHPIKSYTKVITMEDFMKDIANKIWRQHERMGFCFSFRDEKKCAMKDGNPFGPFWDHFNVTFNSYEEHYPLLWDTQHNSWTRNEWLKRFPASKYPVIAFQGAPGNFPSQEPNQHLQKYVHFSDYLNQQADLFISKFIMKRKFIGIHLRNGIDFTRVCDDIGTDKYDKIFSSVQCTGYNNAITLTQSMCDPSKEDILKKIKEVMKVMNIEALFVATDHDPMKRFLDDHLKVPVFYRDGPHNEADDPLIDIAILSKSDYFIGNCVSSFSAFVRRHRETRKLPFTFFGLTWKDEKVKDEM